MIKICFVEDSPVAHLALKTIIQESQLLDLVGMYSSAEAFMNEYSFVQPDITIIDINLPGISGIEAIFTIRAEFPEAKFLVLTIYDDAETIFRALKAGAGGYLLKKDSLEKLVEEIILFSNGGAPVTPQIAAKIIGFFNQAKGFTILNRLTEKEKSILELIAEGLLYKEIAYKKSITIDGIKKHVSKIYEKLQVRTRSEAIKKYFTEML